MVNAVRIIASCLLFLAIRAAGQEAQSEFRFRVKIPKAIAVQEASRLAGNDQVPPPILMLQGLENPANQGMTIEVRAEPQRGVEESAPVLAVTGLVGEPNAAPGSSPGEIVLPVPLNEAAAKFLANRSEIVF